jgi:FtsP/CotA-like multicopper oxidase with cupredoxin domain
LISLVEDSGQCSLDTYNRSIPGPTLRVREGSELVVEVVNEGELDGTVHWRGLQLNNRYDGTLETQAPIPVGGTLSYQVTFPDPGVYWYHPHIRKDDVRLEDRIRRRPARGPDQARGWR